MFWVYQLRKGCSHGVWQKRTDRNWIYLNPNTEQKQFNINVITTPLAYFAWFKSMARTFIHNATQDTHLYSKNHWHGQIIATIRDTSFLTFSKQEKFLSKLKIENELYVHLIFSVTFLLPTRGLGLWKSCFRYASREKNENCIQRLRFSLENPASFVAHLYYSMKY